MTREALVIKPEKSSFSHCCYFGTRRKTRLTPAQAITHPFFACLFPFRALVPFLREASWDAARNPSLGQGNIASQVSDTSSGAAVSARFRVRCCKRKSDLTK